MRARLIVISTVNRSILCLRLTVIIDALILVVVVVVAIQMAAAQSCLVLTDGILVATILNALVSGNRGCCCGGSQFSGKYQVWLQHDELIVRQTQFGRIQCNAARFKGLAVTEFLVQVARRIVFGSNNYERSVATIDHLLGECLGQVNAVTEE